MDPKKKSSPISPEKKSILVSGGVPCPHTAVCFIHGGRIQKEIKKEMTHKSGREGWEDVTPPPHREFEMSVVLDSLKTLSTPVVRTF